MKRLSKNSLVMRNLVRHRVAPPTFHFKDRKKEMKREACRKKDY